MNKIKVNNIIIRFKSSLEHLNENEQVFKNYVLIHLLNFQFNTVDHAIQFC